MALTKVTGAGIGTVTNQFADANMAAGSVVQVVSAFKKDTQTFSSTTYTDITGMSVSITPKATSSTILILFYIGGQGQHQNSQMIIRLMRDSTSIAAPDASGSRSLATIQGFYSHDDNVAECGAAMFLDSPSSSSSITYKLQGAGTTSNNAYINRPNDLSDSIGRVLGTSSIIAMEIAG